MNTGTRGRLLFAALSLGIVALLGCRSSNNVQVSTHSLRVGVAELDVTPPVGYRMAGYFNERISTGVHDPLKAKAIVMQQGRTTFAFVFNDMVGVTLDITSKARELAIKQTGIPVSIKTVI